MACSASTYTHVSPIFCAWDTTCRATVVLPELSAPYTSTMRPRGRPPMPRAASRARDPVGITSTTVTADWPSCMMEPRPWAAST
jgi:hypothetical protein